MSKAKIITLVTVIIALVVASVYFFTSKDTSEETVVGHYPIEKHFKWRYKVVNTSDEQLKDVSLKVLRPVELTANQKLKSIEASRQNTTETDQFGNSYFVFEFEEVQPYQTLFVDIKAAVEFSLSSQPMSSEEIDSYLAPSKNIESDHEKIISLANQLKQEDTKATLKNYYNWIVGNMNYSGYVKEDLGALYALEQKKGDCTEYSYLMAALARASGVPARVIGGYVYSENSLVKSEDFHNWVEVYINDRWTIIDPQKERFMENAQEYLAVHVFPPQHQFDNSHQVVISSSSIDVSL